VVLAVKAPVLSLPLVAFAPANVPPVPVQEVALLELQVSVEAAPLSTAPGLDDSEAVGTGAVTVTVAAAAGLVPAAPVQVREYVVSAVNAPVLRVPLVPTAPVQPPEALQDVALVELHVKVAAPPLLTVTGDAVIDAVGDAGAVATGARDPPPQAVSRRAAPMAIPGVEQRVRVLS
jgi:hypothetical protein